MCKNIFRYNTKENRQCLTILLPPHTFHFYRLLQSMGLQEHLHSHRPKAVVVLREGWESGETCWFTPHSRCPNASEISVHGGPFAGQCHRVSSTQHLHRSLGIRRSDPLVGNGLGCNTKNSLQWSQELKRQRGGREKNMLCYSFIKCHKYLNKYVRDWALTTSLIYVMDGHNLKTKHRNTELREDTFEERTEMQKEKLLLCCYCWRSRQTVVTTEEEMD